MSSENQTGPAGRYLRDCRGRRGLSLRAAGELLHGMGWAKSKTAAKHRLQQLEVGKATKISLGELAALRNVLGAEPTVMLALYLGEVPTVDVRNMDAALCAWAWLNFDQPGVLAAYKDLAESRDYGILYYEALQHLRALLEESSFQNGNNSHEGVTRG